ncbi:MAG: NUDIX hydrolase [Thermoplasmata archaeon]|nr:NUDIX hydrolase [Thermoplasmata archaeon]
MEYKKPSLTVDAIILIDGKLVLIKRGKDPFKGQYALPGGFVEYGERVEEAVEREVKEETGLNAEVSDFLGVYSAPDRDPRGHTISVVFYLEKIGGQLSAGDDAAEVKLFDLANLPELAFDHSEIIHDFIMRLTD